MTATERRLMGRRILVTGASRGIGEVSARALAGAGARVALLARSTAPLEALAQELGGFAVPADVVDPTATRAAVQEAAEALGGLDGVLNAAGVVRPGLIGATAPEDWQLTFDVNVLGLLHVTQAAMPSLRDADHADIVNLSSMSGRRVGSPEMGVYAASKAAVHTLSGALRREVAADGVRVTIVAPGFVRTDIFGGQESPVARDLGRRAGELGLTPEQVAEVIVGIVAAPPEVSHVEVALTSSAQAAE